MNRKRLSRALRNRVGPVAIGMCGVLLAAAGLEAQEPLSLERAVEIALESHPAMAAADAGVSQADAEITVAHAGRLPDISVSESYTRSNNPVFAFSSLLNQRRFAETDFAIDRLNHPGSIQNFQSAVRVEQTLFDASRAKHAIRAARLRSDLSAEQKRMAESQVLLGVARTYWGARIAHEALAVTEQAVATAEASLKRARDRFEAGLATRADVLAVQTHLAAASEQRIRAQADAEVAQAALSDALGLELDRRFSLTTPIEDQGDATELEQYLGMARESRPDLRQAAIQELVRQEERRGAESALYPRAVAFGAVQADTRRFVAGGSGSWLAGVSLEWNVWDGNETRARIESARYSEQKAAAERRQASSRALLEVRRAHADAASAGERVRTTESVIEQAEEADRIIRNRYEAGLTDVTELLRGETALTEARFRRLAALYDRRVARAALSHAAGALTQSSEVLR